jgi:adenine phosphoribosyltransferase
LNEEQLKGLVREIPDFPQKGILFRDITPLLTDSAAFSAVVDAMASWARARQADSIVAIESRGFLFGAPLALALGVPFVPVRKEGKLPSERVSVQYELEYGFGKLELHRDALRHDQRAVIVDDLIATGGTARATAELCETLGARVAGFQFVIELAGLKGRERLAGYDINSLLIYPGT